MGLSANFNDLLINKYLLLPVTQCNLSPVPERKRGWLSFSVDKPSGEQISKDNFQISHHLTPGYMAVLACLRAPLGTKCHGRQAGLEPFWGELGTGLKIKKDESEMFSIIKSIHRYAFLIRPLCFVHFGDYIP